MIIRRSEDADLARIFTVINEAARAYREVIPADRWHEPYMPEEELAREIAGGIVFWVAERDGALLGVMGMQDKGAVALVRHAYVSPAAQRAGVGTTLLRHVQGLTDKPILIGTWADASWPSTSIGGTDSRCCRTTTSNGCCGRTGRSRSGRSRPPSSWPIDDGWKRNH